MKRNSIFKQAVLFLVAGVLLTACYDDKGNYDYIDLNEITFSGINENYRINIGEPLAIYPVLHGVNPDNEEDYEYLWLKLGVSKNDKIWDTVYRGKTIDNVVVSKLTPSDVAYPVIYQVKDKKHDVIYTSDYFYVKVDKDIASGFLILTNNDGKTDLRFLNYINNNVSRIQKLDPRVVDLFALPEDLGAPITVCTYSDTNAPVIGGSLATTGFYAVSLVTESGLYRLRWNDFHYEDAYNGKYVIGGDLSGLQIKGMYASSSNQFYTAMLRDQMGNYMMYQRYNASSPSSAGVWFAGVYCNRYQGVNGAADKVFPALPTFGYSGNYVVFYDTESKSFALRESAVNYSRKYAVEEPYFTYNNTPFEPIWIFTRYMSAIYQTYSIVRDRTSGDLNIISFNTRNGEQLFNIPIYPKTNKGGSLPGIETAKFFAINPSSVVDYKPFLYYATNTAVYVFHMTDMSVAKVFDAPAGTTIKEMRFTKEESDYRSAPPVKDFENQLVIVTEGNTANSTTFEIYDVEKVYGTLTLKELGYSDGEKQLCRWTGLPSYVAFDFKCR